MNTVIENDKVFDYLFTVGDTHGNNKQLASHLLPNLPQESKKAILHVGDFGVGFCPTVDGELVGDPLEIKMFHSTDWELDETVQKEKDNEEEYLC